MNVRLILVNLLHIFNDGYQAAFLLLLPFIAKDLNISLTQIGGLGSLMYFMEPLLALPAGQIGSRYDGIRILIILMLVFSLGYLGLLGVSSFLMLLIPFMLIGIAYGLFHPVGFAMVVQFSQKKSRGTTIGDFTAIGDLGRIVFPSIITYLAAFMGWKSTSLAFGLSAFVLFIAVFVFYHNKRKHNIHQEKAIDTVKILDIIRNKRFLLAISISALDSVASNSLFLFLPFLLIHKGINPSILGSFAAAYFVGNLLGKATIGRLADKHGYAGTFIIAELLMVVCIFLLTLSNTPLLIILTSVALGALTKGTIPARTSITIETVEHHGRFEKAISVNTFLISIVGSLAPALYGRIADLWGINFTFYTSAVFALLAIIPAFVFEFTRVQPHK